MLETIQFVVIGEDTMHCAGCEQRVGTVLRRLPGVESVAASVQTQQIDVSVDPNLVGVEQLQAKLEQAGYTTALAGGTHDLRA